MSIRHMAEIWSDPYFGQGDKVKLLVALSIADNARAEDGCAWPAIESIARKARTSVRGAQEACAELAKDGKLEIAYGKGPHGTNMYRITPRTDCTPSPDLQSTPPHGMHPAKRAPRKRAPEKPAEKPAPVCTQTIRNHQEPPSIISEPPPPALPAGGFVEGRGRNDVPTTEQSKRIAAMFHRKLTTPWTQKEIESYKRIGTLDADDLSSVERYYAANWPPRHGVNVLRHDLLTFLNNVTGEIDRANAFALNPIPHDRTNQRRTSADLDASKTGITGEHIPFKRL